MIFYIQQREEAYRPVYKGEFFVFYLNASNFLQAYDLYIEYETRHAAHQYFSFMKIKKT